MDALDMRAPAEVFAPRRVRSDLTEQRLREFRPELRGPVKALARRHRNLADLATSFPALLFALAHPRKGFDPEPAIRAVVAGQSLKEIAGLVALPLWLRSVEPHMFTTALPALPDNDDLRRSLVNHLPRSPKHFPLWLGTVATAVRDGTDQFAVWCARHLVRGPDRDLKLRLRMLCLYAWYSAHRETRAHEHLVKVFHPAMTVKNAVTQACLWYDALELDLYLGDGPLADVWYETDIVDGYEFVPIRSAAEIREEARVMSNCVKTYGYGLSAGDLRLFSVRKDGQRVATASLDFRPGWPMPALTQLKSAGNLKVSNEITVAAQRWLYSRNLRERRTREVDIDALINRATWLAMWKPYWLAKRLLPAWLPIGPSYRALTALQSLPLWSLRRRRRRRVQRVIAAD
jgi:hypothetical protein